MEYLNDKLCTRSPEFRFKYKSDHLGVFLETVVSQLWSACREEDPVPTSGSPARRDIEVEDWFEKAISQPWETVWPKLLKRYVGLLGR